VAAAALRWVAAIGLGAGMLSCLPASDLSGYSSGASPLEAAPADALAPGGVSTEAEAVANEPAPGEESPAPGAAATPNSDCTGECPAPVLTGTETDNGAQGASSAEPESGNEAAPNAGMPGETGAGAPEAEPAPSCIAGAALGPNGRCVLLGSVASSWQTARASCQSHGTGWDLAKIRDAQQNTWLSALLGTVQDAWVGASDLQTEGAWRWVGDRAAFWNGPGSTGSRVRNAYVNWNSGAAPEPNGGESSDCLRLRNGGGWADLECSTALLSICDGPTL